MLLYIIRITISINLLLSLRCFPDIDQYLSSLNAISARRIVSVHPSTIGMRKGNILNIENTFHSYVFLRFIMYIIILLFVRISYFIRTVYNNNMPKTILIKYLMIWINVKQPSADAKTTILNLKLCWNYYKHIMHKSWNETSQFQVYTWDQEELHHIYSISSYYS